MPVIALEYEQQPPQQLLACQLGLFKSLGGGRWNSEAYQSYIHPSPMVLQSVPSLLARTDTSQQSPWDPDATNTPVLSANTVLP